jgi:hypothetical protein
VQITVEFDIPRTIFKPGNKYTVEGLEASGTLDDQIKEPSMLRTSMLVRLEGMGLEMRIPDGLDVGIATTSQLPAPPPPQ